MPEAGLQAAKDELQNFLEGDEHHPGLVPWDFDAGVEPPPGVELRYRPEDQTLWVLLREHGVRIRYRWDGYRWVEEESDEAPEEEPAGPGIDALARALERLEERVARLERMLLRCLEERG